MCQVHFRRSLGSMGPKTLVSQQSLKASSCLILQRHRLSYIVRIRPVGGSFSGITRLPFTCGHKEGVDLWQKDG